MNNYLYLLVSKENDKFKIGITNDPASRIRLLSETWGDFDLDESFMVEGDRDFVTSLEKTLHFMFANWRVDGLSGAGYTEWFYMVCLGDVIAEIDRIAELRDQDVSVTKGVYIEKPKHDPAIKTLFSESRYSLFKALLTNPEDRYYTRQIINISNMGRGTIQRELERLRDFGIIIKKREENRVYYQANTNHPLYNPIVEILEYFDE